MKFKFWKYFVGLVIVSLFLFVANVVCVLVRKHDVCFNRSGECLWLFKQKDKVDTTMQVQQVGVNDIFYLYHYTDSIRVCVWKFANIKSVKQSIIKSVSADPFEGIDNLENKNLDSFIIMNRFRFLFKNSIYFKISTLNDSISFFKSHNYYGMISTLDKVVLSEDQDDICIYYTEPQKTIFLILKENNSVYAIIVEGNSRNVQIDENTLKMFSFVGKS